MGTNSINSQIEERLAALTSIRTALRQSIENKGIMVPVDTPFSIYPSKIEEISSGSGGSTWTRPSEWLPAPSLSANELYFLLELRDGHPNAMGFRMQYADIETSLITALPITIDWGDGRPPVISASDNRLNLRIYDYDDPYFQNNMLPNGTKQVVIKVAVPSSIPHQVYGRLYVSSFGIRTSELSYEINKYLPRVLEIKSNIAFSSMVIDKLLQLENLVVPVTWPGSADRIQKQVSIDYAGIKNLQLVGQPVGNAFEIILSNCMFLKHVTCPTNTQLSLSTTGVESVTTGGSLWLPDLQLSTSNNLLKSVTLTAIDLNIGFTFTRSRVHKLDFRDIPVTYPDTDIAVPTYFGFLDQFYLQELYVGDVFVTSAVEDFTRCYQLRKLVIPSNAFSTVYPLENTGYETSMLSFTDCISLQSVVVQSIHPVYTYFSGCPSLLEVEFGTGDLSILSALPVSLFTNTRCVYAVKNCTLPVSFSLANMYLSAAALNQVYSDLPTVVGKTITVTGNPGTSQPEHDPSIATAKGWTVTV